MPKPQGKNQRITDKQRQEVRRLLFELLRVHDPALKDEVETFKYSFMTPTGDVMLKFRPGDGFIDWAIGTSDRVVRKTLEAATETLVSEGKITKKTASSPKVIGAIKKKGPDVLSAYIAYLTMQNLIPKVMSVFSELGLESQKVLESIIFLAMKRSGLDQKTGFQVPNIAGGLKELSKDLVDQRRKYVMSLINTLDKSRLSLLPNFYPSMLKTWQTVKKIYAANNESETWRDMVKAKYPDISFDDDLLTRITGNFGDLPEDIRTKLAETDGDHTPSSIALEHSARLCGESPYAHGTRHLYRLAKASIKTDEI